MTLLDKLTSLKKTFCYVGSNNHGGFICLSPADEIINLMPDMDEEYVAGYEKQLRHRKNFVDNTDDYRASWEAKITMLKEKLDKDPDGLDAEQYKHAMEKMQFRLDNLPKEIEYSKDYIARIERYLKTRKPFLARKVVEVYDRKFVEPLGKIIIVEGIEEGKYWDEQEWLNRGVRT